MLKTFPCHDVVIKHSLVLSGCQIPGIKGNTSDINHLFFRSVSSTIYFSLRNWSMLLVSQKQAFSWSEADQECKTRGASLIALETEEK